MYDLDNLKLELAVKNKINRMDLVKARAEMRTKRRIAEMLEKKTMKELEKKVAQQNRAKGTSDVSVAEPTTAKFGYTATVTANGNTQYRKDGKLISKAEYETAN